MLHHADDSRATRPLNIDTVGIEAYRRHTVMLEISDPNGLGLCYSGASLAAILSRTCESWCKEPCVRLTVLSSLLYGDPLVVAVEFWSESSGVSSAASLSAAVSAGALAVSLAGSSPS